MKEFAKKWKSLLRELQQKRSWENAIHNLCEAFEIWKIDHPIEFEHVVSILCMDFKKSIEDGLLLPEDFW